MLEISVPYNLAFAQLVASFMEEAGACYGADEREKNHLRLAGEEAFAFIMAGIPASGLKDQFKLVLVLYLVFLLLDFQSKQLPPATRSST